MLPGLAGITPAAYAHPAQLSTGFHHAMRIAGALCAFGGLLSATLLEPHVLADARTNPPSPTTDLVFPAGAVTFAPEK